MQAIRESYAIKVMKERTAEFKIKEKLKKTPCVSKSYYFTLEFKDENSKFVPFEVLFDLTTTLGVQDPKKRQFDGTPARFRKSNSPGLFIFFELFETYLPAIAKQLDEIKDVFAKKAVASGTKSFLNLIKKEAQDGTLLDDPMIYLPIICPDKVVPTQSFTVTKINTFKKEGHSVPVEFNSSNIHNIINNGTQIKPKVNLSEICIQSKGGILSIKKRIREALIITAPKDPKQDTLSNILDDSEKKLLEEFKEKVDLNKKQIDENKASEIETPATKSETLTSAVTSSSYVSATDAELLSKLVGNNK